MLDSSSHSHTPPPPNPPPCTQVCATGPYLLPWQVCNERDWLRQHILRPAHVGAGTPGLDGLTAHLRTCGEFASLSLMRVLLMHTIHELLGRYKLRWKKKLACTIISQSSVLFINLRIWEINSKIRNWDIAQPR